MRKSFGIDCLDIVLVYVFVVDVDKVVTVFNLTLIYLWDFLNFGIC